MSSVELQSNELFEELTEGELMTLVGGTGGTLTTAVNTVSTTSEGVGNGINILAGTVQAANNYLDSQNPIKSTAGPAAQAGDALLQ